MKKTRKWILISTIIFVGSIFVAIYSEIIDGLLLVAIIFIPTIIFTIIPIYLMFQWSTKYNLEKFGFKSRKEWIRSKNNSIDFN